MNPTDTAEIGKTGLRVTRLGLGAGPLGGLRGDAPRDVAHRVVQRAFELGVRYFDTAPRYGHGISETFVGETLSSLPRQQFALSTKVGRVLNPIDTSSTVQGGLGPQHLEAVFDYSRDGVLRSLEDSLRRLKLERIDIALIHDLDEAEEEDPHHWRRGVEEAYPTLHDLRSQGVVKAIGAGLNEADSCLRLVRDCDIDCLIMAGRYTLLDQSGLPELLPLCQRRGISVILGAPYNSGILASDLSPGATYFYEEAPSNVLERARRIKSVCDTHTVPLKAAALQFGLAHPAIEATIPGARSEAEVEENVAAAGYPIPHQLWADLKSQGLIPENAPTPPAGREGS